MKGLLLKDFYTTKANIFIAILSCIVMAIGLAIVISPSVVIILIAIPLRPIKLGDSSYSPKGI